MRSIYALAMRLGNAHRNHQPILFRVLNPVLCTGRGRVSRRTTDLHEHYADLLYRHFGLDFRVDRMTREHLAGYVEERLRSVAAPTLNNELRFLAAAMDRAWERGLFRALPVPIRTLPVPTRRSARVYTVDELNRILATAKAPGRAMFALITHAGLRVDEVRRLCVGDVDASARLVRVRAPSGPRKRWCRERRVSIGAASALLEEAIAGLGDVSADAWLFPGGETSGLISRTHFYRLLREACVAAQVEYLGAEAIRRTKGIARPLGSSSLERCGSTTGVSQLPSPEKPLRSLV